MRSISILGATSSSRALIISVLLALAGLALLLGGVWLDAFIIVLALAACAEFLMRALKGGKTSTLRIVALIAGTAFVGVATIVLVGVDGSQILAMAAAVVAFEIVARFIDRRSRGRRVAPSINAARTWLGFGSGAIGAGVSLLATSQLYATPLCRWYYDAWDSLEPELGLGVFAFDDRCHIWSPPFDLTLIGMAFPAGLLYAAIAQSGDFLTRSIVRRTDSDEGRSPTAEPGGLMVLTSGLYAVAIVTGMIRMIIF